MEAAAWAAVTDGSRTLPKPNPNPNPNPSPNPNPNPNANQLKTEWLTDPLLLEQRQADAVHLAFRDALVASQDPAFDVGIVELLMDHGAKSSEVHLAYLMDNVEDVFNIMGDYKRKRKRKNERFEEAMKEYLEQATAVRPALESVRREAGKGGAVPARSLRWQGVARRAVEGEREAHGGQVASMTFGGVVREAVLKDVQLRKLQEWQATDAVANRRSPWTDDLIVFFSRSAKIDGFKSYATEQTAVHNIDLMFWAISTGKIAEIPP